MSNLSSRKGNGFENKILRELRQVYPDTYKTIGSGNAKDDKGDIVFKQYLIECKFHRSFSRKELNDYLTKVTKEAEAINKIPVLVYKENRKDTMVMFWGVQTVKTMMYFDDWISELEGEGYIGALCPQLD